ncbi:MAG: hypothetical protein ACLPVO_13350 [Desulfomonilaceae bacterium]
MILALNLNSAMKRMVLGEHWMSKRLKAVRFLLIKLPGRLLDRARMLLFMRAFDTSWTRLQLFSDPRLMDTVVGEVTNWNLIICSLFAMLSFGSLHKEPLGVQFTD